jgi:acyl-CoA dehydrogenase
VPYERDPRMTAHGPTDALRIELNALARRAGLFAPQLPADLGGLGLTHLQQALVFEAAGYSPLGPIALHCAAPDEGNMHLLSKVANAAQRERYLRPLAAGECRSCFAMTEPHPGAGSDPAQLTTTARRIGDRYVVQGRKWLITGAANAGFMIVMARTEAQGQDLGATMFLVPLPDPAVRIVRLIDSLDSSFSEGHAELAIDGLGEVGQGLRYAQMRACAGQADPLHALAGRGDPGQRDRARPCPAEACVRQAARRARRHRLHAGGQRHGSARGAPHDLAGRLAARPGQIRPARVEPRQGDRLRGALPRGGSLRADILGGLGITGDTVVQQVFRELRAFRIYDGPSEVHRWAIARRLASGPRK